MRIKIWLCGVAVASTLSCWGEARGETLYEALGGRPGLERIAAAADLAFRADSRVAAPFEDTNPARLQRLLVDQLCSLTGGGCTYTGRDMRAAHKALSLSRAQFDAVAEDLQGVMTEQGVPPQVQSQLMSLLAPMERDVVTR